MATQNLVSAEISAEQKESILQTLADLKSKCSFVVTLSPEEIKGLFKAGDSYSTFLDKAFNVANTYPEILPAVFNRREFERDYKLAVELKPIISEFRSLMESLENTLIAANSDTMIGALEVYAFVQQNIDKVPGLNSVYEEMSKYFKRTRKTQEKPTQ